MWEIYKVIFFLTTGYSILTDKYKKDEQEISLTQFLKWTLIKNIQKKTFGRNHTFCIS